MCKTEIWVLTSTYRLKIISTDFYLFSGQVLLLLKCYVKCYCKYWSSFGEKKKKRGKVTQFLGKQM